MSQLDDGSYEDDDGEQPDIPSPNTEETETEETNENCVTFRKIIEELEQLPEEITGFDDHGIPKHRMNDLQYKAAKMALNEDRKLVCIQGAAGTGKTYVLANVLCRLVQKGSQAIVLTPTSDALQIIKELTEKMLIDKKLVHDEYTCMDYNKYVEIYNGTDAVVESRELIRIWKQQFKDGQISRNRFKEMSSELKKTTGKEQGEKTMDKVSLVFATIGSNLEVFMQNGTFHPCVCIIDHANQVKDTTFWKSTRELPRIVMTGDPKQLPPYYRIYPDQPDEVPKSILDQVLEKKDHFSWTMLEGQYRCHPKISCWSNQCLYDGRIIDHVKDDSTLHYMLVQKFPVGFRKVFDPLVLVDTSVETDETKRVTMYEQVNLEKEDSFENIGEARIALRHYVHLRQAGIPAESIAIITPYRGQADLLREGIDKVTRMQSKDGTFPFTDSLKTTVGTVDSVQGQEYSVVIFSMVRSNPRKIVGFVSDLRRLNVVITRAKHHFMFIGNGFLMANSHVPEIRTLFDICKNSGHRFHPDHANLIATRCPSTVYNNFGQDFAPFIEHTRDEEMKKWCIAFVERGKDPAFRQAQFAKKQQRYLAKRREESEIADCNSNVE